MLTARLAAFEIRYQLRNPVFWVSVAIFFLLGFGLASSDAVSFGSPGAVHENSPYTLTIAMARRLRRCRQTVWGTTTTATTTYWAPWTTRSASVAPPPLLPVSISIYLEQRKGKHEAAQ